MDKTNQAVHLAELQTLTTQFSESLQAQFIPVMEKTLADLADAATTDEEQFHCLRMAADLRRRKASLLTGFRQCLIEGFEQFGNGTLGGKDTSQEDTSFDLALLASDEQEQSIATISLTRRVETRFSESLIALDYRLAIVRGGRKLPEDGNPLGAGQFAAAMRAEIGQLELDAPHAVIFYRVFEKILLESLADLYHEANQYLIRQGILPNLRIRPRQEPAPVADRPSTEAVSEEILDTLTTQRRLYAEISALRQSWPAVDLAASCTKSDVVVALSGFQFAHHADTIEQMPVPPAMTIEHYSAVTRHVQQHFGAEKSLSEECSQLIDVVGMIFDYLLSDRDLPSPVKAVLSYLHTPYLKAAFADHAVLENPEHPSRLLLNLLADAGGRWVNQTGESQFKVFPKIKSVVRAILTHTHHDMNLFAELFAETQEFCLKVERNISAVERRACEKAEGEDRLRMVKRRVLHEVLQRMEGHELPAAAIVLLLNPWADYLTFSLLRYGEDSRHWEEGLAAIDDIVWSVQAKSSAAERNRLIVLQEALHASVQAGLETIAHDQVRSDKLLQALHESQMLTLQNQVAEPVSPERRREMETIVMSDLSDDEVDLNKLNAEERKYLEQLQQIGSNKWLEFDSLGEQRNLRVRIAWSNAVSSHFLLVDRSGKEVAMMKGPDMVRLMQSNRMRILDVSSKPFFERSLEHVLARLRLA